MGTTNAMAVKRPVAASLSLVFLMMAPLVITARPAAANAVGACTITGTMKFSKAAPSAPDGRWAVSPGVISCRGVYNGWERIINPGSFTASGAFSAFPPGGPCAVALGAGTFDYWVLTSEQDIHFKEPHTFTPGSAGAVATPSLRGGFQIPPDAGCLSGSAAETAPFMAEVTLVRTEDPGLHR
jgi:hypothetical protein